MPRLAQRQLVAAAVQQQPAHSSHLLRLPQLYLLLLLLLQIAAVPAVLHLGPAAPYVSR
jgi:hypothetical protein